MHGGDRGGVARPRFGEGGRAAAKQASEKAHHRRGSEAAFCGCASGARRYCGFGGACASGTTAPICATQPMSGASRASTVMGAARLWRARRRPLVRPSRRCGQAASDAARTASLKGASRGAIRVRPPGSENLQIDMLVPRIDRGDHRNFVVGGEIRRGIGGKRRHADDRHAGGDAKAARGRNADPQAGEAAGPRRHHDAVEIGERQAGLFHHPRDQRHQRFGMAAHHRQAFARENAAIRPCRARQRSRPPAPYQWRARAWRVTSRAAPAQRAGLHRAGLR